MVFRRTHLFFAAVLGSILWVGTALPKTATLQKQGRWEAFGGTDDAGARVCGVINTEDADRVFAVKRYAGSRDLAVQMLKDGWRIAADQRVALVLRFDSYPPWEVEALPAPPDGLRLRIPQDLADAFIREFGSSRTLHVTFTSNNDQPWALALAGSPQVSRAMVECAAKLDSPPAAPRR